MAPDETSELVTQINKLRDSLDATRDSLNELVTQIDRRSRRRVNRVVAALLVVASFVGFNAWSRYVDNVETCKRSNETRALIRSITKEASLASGEALIDVAGADDETVGRYRTSLEERLTEVVNRLGDRNC